MGNGKSSFTAYCDGSIKANPGGRAVGAWVVRSSDDLVLKGTFDLGVDPLNTVNCAEYAAVEHMLISLKAIQTEWNTLDVKSDSQLIIKQLNKEWKCQYDHLYAYRARIFKLCDEYKSQGKQITFSWIPRELNKEADALSKSLYEKSENS